jgi:tRNA-dihydrouridine synthase B
MNLIKNNVPLLSLGPMAGVTDKAFRRICREFGLEFAFSEMVSAKGLYYNDDKTKELIDIEDWDQPIAIQLFGSDPIIMGESVKILDSIANFQQIDINMGCPAPKIVKNGDGSALMKDIKNASKIVETVKKNTTKPVSVKFRLGWDSSDINALKFAFALEKSGADLITVHGRTRDQMYSGKADWNVIKEIKENIRIPIIGNGDIFTSKDALEKKKFSGVDGIMIARGVQGNPWLIKEILESFRYNRHIEYKPGIIEIVDVLKRHFSYMLEYKSERNALLEMRKHGAWYLKGLSHSASTRDLINKCESVKEFNLILDRLVDNNV